MSSFAQHPVPSRPVTAVPRRAPRAASSLVLLAALSTLACGEHGVTPPDGPDTVVARIVLTPSSASLAVGGSVTLTAQARNGADSVLSSAVPTWSRSRQPRVELSTTSGAATVATGTSEGGDTVVVSAGGVQARVVLTVTGTVVPVATVVVSPGSATVEVGKTTRFTASVAGPGGEPLTDRPISWTSTTPAVATVDDAGLVTAVATGQVRIVAGSGGKADTAVVTVTPPSGAGDAPVLVAVGDIAWCSGGNDEKVAAVVDQLLQGGASALAVLGDIAYESGTATEFQTCYGPAWGKFKSVTWPTPGNHEYITSKATPYYQYFGARAGDPAKGYYSYDLGSWHVVVLNANADFVPVTASSAQGQWLAADLAAHPTACTLAYWHQPRFSSGLEHGNDAKVQPLWDALYAAGADVVLNGHDHDYERFAPQDPSGAPDAAKGITEFVVGTGGRSLYSLGTRKANSAVFDASTYGVLKLTLRAGGYDYTFVPAAGGHAIESGSGTCH